METLIEIFIQIIVVVIFGAIGRRFGSRAEKKHYAAIQKAEEQYRHILMLGDADIDQFAPTQTMMISASVAIANDYFKTLMSGLVNFFGGRMHVYETLLDRARRESIIRLKKQVADEGFTHIAHYRMETAMTSDVPEKSSGQVCVISYATAIKCSQ